MFDLTDRVALVTGGSRGIGRAISVALAKQGSYVVVNYAGNEAAAAETLAQIESAGGHGEIVRFDVADAAAVDASVKDVVARKGKLDILVNNAGVAMDQLLARVKQDEIDRTFAVNVEGTLHCSKAAIRSMMRQRHGRIINLSSVIAELGNAGQVVYGASKAAIIGLTKSIAREYASRNITVNCVAPGFIETDMTSELGEAQQKWILEQTPLGRIGKADDVAAAVIYLASDEAGFVTGQTVRVNGGLYI